MSYTVLGLFDDRTQAQSVRQDLHAIGISDSNIEIRSGADQGDHRSFWEQIKDFFTGEDEAHGSYFAEGLRRGGTVVDVESPDDKVDQVVAVLQRHHAVDVDDRAATWRKSGWTGYSATAPAMSAADLQAERTRYANQRTATTTSGATAQATGQQRVAIPVVEEELKLGKRQVQRGGVRIVRRVTERPVSETINLREERVDVQRRPVDRPVTAADVNDAFKDKTIEVTETAEEPVAAKSARVTEEVVVNKDVSQRQAQVKDTVRKTDVQVERVPGKNVEERTDKTDQSTTSSTERKRTTP